MLISLEIHMKTPNTRDFHYKILQFEHFYAEYTKKSEHSMRFSQKIGKITILSIELTSNLTTMVEKSEKIGIFSKIDTDFQLLFLQIITCG